MIRQLNTLSETSGKMAIFTTNATQTSSAWVNDATPGAKVLLNTVTVNNLDCCLNTGTNTVAINKSGLYRFSGKCYWENVNFSNTEFALAITRNDVDSGETRLFGGSIASYFRLDFNVILACKAGDLIEYFALSSNTQTNKIPSGAIVFHVQRLSA